MRIQLIVNDDQQDATIWAYLFIPNQLYILFFGFLLGSVSKIQVGKVIGAA